MTPRLPESVENLRDRLPKRTQNILAGDWSLQSTWASVSSVAWTCFRNEVSFEEFSDLLWQSDLGQSYFADNRFKSRQQFDKNIRGAWDNAEAKLDWGYSERVVREKLAALLAQLQTAAWPGRGGSSERAVAIALVTLAHEVNRYTVDATVRELASRSGFGVKAVSGALKRLAAKRLFSVRASQAQEHSTRNYQINLDWKTVRSKGETYKDIYPPTTLYVPLLLSTVHPCWSPEALGPSARRLWEVLSETPSGATAKVLVTVTGMSLRTVRTHLNRMVGHGLLRKAGNRNAVYTVSPTADLTAVVEEYGVTDWQERREDRYSRERDGYQEFQRQRANGQQPVDGSAVADARQEQMREQAREVLDDPPLQSPQPPPAWVVNDPDLLVVDDHQDKDWWQMTPVGEPALDAEPLDPFDSAPTDAEANAAGVDYGVKVHPAKEAALTS